MSRTSAMLPLPQNAGVRVYIPIREVKRRGLGLFSEILGLGSTIAGGLIGKSAQKAQLTAQEHMAYYQAQAALSQARMMAASQDLATRRAARVAEMQAGAQLSAIRTQAAADLASVRAQERVARQTLSSQLAMSTQGGIFSLAQSGVEQAGGLSRAFPRVATTSATLMVLGAIGFAAWAMKPQKRKVRRRRKKKEPETTDVTMTPMTLSRLEGTP